MYYLNFTIAIIKIIRIIVQKPIIIFFGKGSSILLHLSFSYLILSGFLLISTPPACFDGSFFRFLYGT